MTRHGQVTLQVVGLQLQRSIADDLAKAQGDILQRVQALGGAQACVVPSSTSGCALTTPSSSLASSPFAHAVSCLPVPPCASLLAPWPLRALTPLGSCVVNTST
jgi:hypothetical protein